MNTAKFLDENNFDDVELLTRSHDLARKLALRELLVSYEELQKARYELLSLNHLEPKEREIMLGQFAKILSHVLSLEKQWEKSCESEEPNDAIDLQNAKDEILERWAAFDEAKDA